MKKLIIPVLLIMIIILSGCSASQQEIIELSPTGKLVESETELSAAEAQEVAKTLENLNITPTILVLGNSEGNGNWYDITTSEGDRYQMFIITTSPYVETVKDSTGEVLYQVVY